MHTPFTHFSIVLLTLSFLCRPCLQTAVRMTEANWRTRRRRITHTSCCWPHRPKSRRPIRNPVKVSVCLSIIQGQVFSFFFSHKITNHLSFFCSCSDFNRVAKTLGSFSRVLVKSLLMLSDLSEHIPCWPESARARIDRGRVHVCRPSLNCSWEVALHGIGLNGIKLGGRLNPELLM